MNDKVQIDKQLFLNLVKYHLCDLNDEKIEENIKKSLKNKLDAALKRELYTKSKTAATEEEKEKARIEYLDLVAMKDSFRY